MNSCHIQILFHEVFFKRVGTGYYRFGTDDHFKAWLCVFVWGDWLPKKKDNNLTSKLMPGETVKLLRVIFYFSAITIISSFDPQ